MRSCATRSTNLNGPEHTGLAPNFSPAACAAFGDTIMPGAVGELREQRRERRRQVEPHRHRVDHVDARHQRELAAAVGALHRLVALDVELDRRGVELLAVVERDAGAQLDRQRLVVRRPLVARWRAAARSSSFSSMSNSLSHSAANTMRPTKVRASVGSSTSGSSARPKRSVVCACAAPAMHERGAECEGPACVHVTRSPRDGKSFGVSCRLSASLRPPAPRETPRCAPRCACGRVRPPRSCRPARQATKG